MHPMLCPVVYCRRQAFRGIPFSCASIKIQRANHLFFNQRGACASATIFFEANSLFIPFKGWAILSNRDKCGFVVINLRLLFPCFKFFWSKSSKIKDSITRIQFSDSNFQFFLFFFCPSCEKFGKLFLNLTRLFTVFPAKFNSKEFKFSPFWSILESRAEKKYFKSADDSLSVKI